MSHVVFIETTGSPATYRSKWRQVGTHNAVYFLYDVQEELLPKHINVEKILELQFVVDHQGPIFAYCYVLPLLDGKVEAHRKYCRQAMNENRAQTEKTCKAFGMLSMHKWIQRIDAQAYVLYYQEMNAPISECRQKFLALQTDEKALAATKTLREQTGLCFEELCPLVERMP